MTELCCEQDLEHYWLAATPFVAGDDISIADLIIIMELTQLQMLEGARQASPNVLPPPALGCLCASSQKS